MGLERYDIMAQVGVGCIGTVYRAIDRGTGRTVGIKLFRTDSTVTRARRYFMNEAWLLSRLAHLHIPAFFDLITGRQPAIVFELIEGGAWKLCWRSGRVFFRQVR